MSNYLVPPQRVLKSNSFELDVTTGINTERNRNIPNMSNSAVRYWSDIDSGKKLLFKVIIDFSIISILGIFILLSYLYGEAYERGFFCNDESLMHPYKSDTVTMTMLISVGASLPIAIILLVEIVRRLLLIEDARPVRLMNWNVPVALQNCIKYSGIFLIGAAFCQTSTDITKLVVGRLRPHFISLCHPSIAGTDCSDTRNQHRYIENYVCTNPFATEKMLREVRLSFPSGHASFAFYTMVFCILYLHYRFHMKCSMFLKNTIQFLLFAMALYTSLSRISDYKHHWSDVFGGSVLGILVAFLTVFCISDLAKISRNVKFGIPRSPARSRV